MQLLHLASRADGVAQPGVPEIERPPANSATERRRDPVMERLVRALLPTPEAEEVLRGFYTDALHASLLKRLAELRGDAGIGGVRRKSMPLQRWRLKRVYEFVEANLQQPIPLAALAGAAGLSRMHFAASFRAATGLRPHDYVIRRRIQQAQALLQGGDTSIVDVALSVGFQTQAHFTTVFKRIVGLTPQRWRLACDGEGRASH
jgi:transcriptional regulator GlxA family with amidase domain